MARLSGVSVRALHHYDALGLLRPSGRTGAGYRLYGDADLLRLQQILIGRALGLPLEEIRRSLDEPGFDRARALRAQRAALARRAEETRTMLRAVDQALAVIDAERKGRTMQVDMKDLFAGFDPARYEAEAGQRWGDTEAYRESARRTKRYTEEDWRRQKAEQAAIYADAFAALQAGHDAGDPAAMDVAERHRLAIDRWFYPCSKTMHAGLADLYEADPRFARNIDEHRPGLTPFLAAAIRANARRA